MKKIFTLFAVLAAGLGIASAQTTVTWSLTDSDNQLGGVANDAKITVSDATYGSGLQPGIIKTSTNGSGTLFSSTASSIPNNTSPLTDGSQDVTFTFSIPEGYGFTPTSVTFYSAADGSGNKHLLDASIASNKFVTGYQPGRNNGADKEETYTIAGVENLEGEVSVVINLYGKPGQTTVTRPSDPKGWILGNMVVSGQLVDLSDVRTKADITWNTEKVSLKVRDAFTSPVLSNPENLPIVYTSNNKNVANVDTDGVITLVEGAVGTAIISATYDGEAEGATYLTTTANVTIEVITNVVNNNYQDPDLVKATVEVDNMFYATKSSYPAGEIFSDDCLAIECYSQTAQGSKSGNYGGYEFTNSLQVRVLHDPEEEDYNTDEFGGGEYGDGTKANETTALKIVPKVNMTLYVFGLRQSVENVDKLETIDDVDKNEISVNHYWGYTPNDGKSIKCIKAGDVADNVLRQEILLGKWNGSKEEATDYLFVITKLELQADQEYELYAVATTYQVNGIGYAIERDPSEVVLRTDVIEYKENAASQTDGNGFTVSRTGGKLSNGSAKINVDGVDYTPIKMKGIVTDAKNQIVYTIAAPEGRIITKATVYAYMSYIGKEGGVDATDASQNYFSEVAGHTFVKDLHGKFANTTDVKEFTFDHIMRNSFDIKLHTNQDADICAVWVVETTHDRHAVAAPAIKLDGVDHESEEAELAGEARLLHVVPAEGHYAYFHFDYAKAETPEPEVPGHGSSDIYDSPAPAPARAEAAGDAPAQVITLNGKEFRLVPEEGIELAKNGTLAYLSHNPANGLKSELKTLSVVGTAPETTMIESVAADNAAAEVEYYNLQGIRVNNPQGGVFIRRQGNDVKKVIL